MGRPASLDLALKRLSGALDQLEAATERLGQARAENRDLEDALALMQEDRSRLADELDTALARKNMLEGAADEIALRLGSAGAVLRRYLASAENDQ